MTTTPVETHESDAGKSTAIVVYVIYLIGVFSVHTLSPIGVILAYLSRNSASPWVRTHFDTQIRMFWTVIGWIVGLCAAAAVLSLVLIGLLLWPVVGLVAIVLTIWFAVRSILGLIALTEGRPAP